MSRRDFIKQTSLAGAGLLLHGHMLQAFAASPQGAPINVGIIGLGGRGKGLIKLFDSLQDKFRVTAVCDNMAFRIEETKKMYPKGNFSYHSNYKEILADKAIQAVVVATPLYLHFQHASDVLAANKHLYLEKTMTYDIPQVHKFVALVQKYPKLTVQVGHQYRYTPLYYKVKDMIQKGYVGKVSKIESLWDFHRDWRQPVPEPSLERRVNWRMYREYSGGMVAELLSHQIDFINWAFDTHPDEIMGIGGVDNYKDGREVYDNILLSLRYNGSGMVGSFAVNSNNGRDGYLFKLKGSKGTVALLMREGTFYPEEEQKKELAVVDGVAGATKLDWAKDGGVNILNEPYKDGTWYALNDFHKCIQSGELPASNVYTGARSAICVHLANQSLYGKMVSKWKPEYNFSKA